MPLRWDPLLVRALAAELRDRLAGARLRALRLDGARRDLVLLFRDATLAWCLHPDRGSPLLLPPAEPARDDLALPTRVRHVRAPADERILVFELLPTRRGESKDLVIELLGNQWNAVVAEGPDARIRHVLIRREGRRPLKVGERYRPPPPSGREGTDEPIGLERWRALLGPVPPSQRPRALVASVAWTSPLNAETLVGAADDPADALDAGYARWRAMAFGDEPPSPVLLTYRGDAQPYPWPLAGTDHERTGTLLDAFRLQDERAAPVGGAEAVLPPELVAGLERAVDAALRRLTRLEAELAGLEDPSGLRAQADLLLARFRDVPPGATNVELEDFTGGRVVVPLDPTRTVQDNAAALYARAGRVERARDRLPELVAKARTEADGLETLLRRARVGDIDAEALRRALPAGRDRAGRAEDPTETLPYRRYRSSGGLEIRVGRGAKRNDELTFRHAAPTDVWMHARHTAGAHVILRWSGPGNPPTRDLHEAAVLAALHSRARTSGSVPVDWTLRKYVRKPRGAAPGSVVPDRVRTVFVEPDPALAERLAEA